MSFTQSWGKLPRNALLDFLGDHAASDYTITDLAEKSGLSRPTVYAALDELLACELVVETRKIGTSRLFAIQTESSLVRAVLSQDFENARATAAKGGEPTRRGRRARTERRRSRRPARAGSTP